jgi:hypothetical protein
MGPSTTLFTLWALIRTEIDVFGNSESRYVTIGKSTLVFPSGTVTVAGTLAAVGTLLNTGITSPPAGAGDVSTRVPVAIVPPVTVLGLGVNDASTGGGSVVPGGSTVKLADRVTPPPVTDTVTTVSTDTVEGRSWTPATVVPAASVVAVARNGSTSGLSLVTCNVRSMLAVELTYTVPLGVEEEPPMTTFGNILNESGTASDVTVWRELPFTGAVIDGAAVLSGVHATANSIVATAATCSR